MEIFINNFSYTLFMKSHDYSKFAKDYSQLDISGTFYIGYRDIPLLLKEYVTGKKALDFGCGAGKSTRFLKELGYNTMGVDKNPDMISQAKRLDKKGTYLLLKEGKIPLEKSSFDVVLVSCVLMEVSSLKEMKEIFLEIHKVLQKGGISIILTDTDTMYMHDTASFIYDFPENKNLKSGMQAKLKFRGTDIIFYDYFWTEKDYTKVFTSAGFVVLEIHKPLATGKESFKWYCETEHPHFVLYVLKK